MHSLCKRQVGRPEHSAATCCTTKKAKHGRTTDAYIAADALMRSFVTLNPPNPGAGRLSYLASTPSRVSAAFHASPRENELLLGWTLYLPWQPQQTPGG